MRTKTHGLLRATALGLALVLFGASCKDRPSADAASERAPVQAALSVAPVVDDHPWVIAFLTEISITRPPGADARLEGRTGTEGLRHPEPIIEAETREALASALSAYEALHPRPPELWPVWQRDPFGPGERVAWRLYFVDRARGFAVDAEARAGIQRHDHGPSVHVQLGPAQSERFAALTQAHVGQRVAVVLENEVVMLPVVMAPILDGDIQLIAKPSQDPELTAPDLLARLTGK
ncbi:preprotein translocase subunit SecD [Enhygromyxa salina]|uniref:Preprotein translocase subunit SecD n=1 Tax=Enhygromyxa salina TaxID=215803 RepID=A0A2S9XBK7_9BACT|nr:hypothetical protein [Enhygromyxa salina]PRP90239.1 preprotein translocase subunit SecD [Enhygromyxa salina]